MVVEKNCLVVQKRIINEKCWLILVYCDVKYPILKRSLISRLNYSLFDIYLIFRDDYRTIVRDAERIHFRYIFTFFFHGFIDCNFHFKILFQNLLLFGIKQFLKKEDQKFLFVDVSSLMECDFLFISNLMKIKILFLISWL